MESTGPRVERDSGTGAGRPPDASGTAETRVAADGDAGTRPLESTGPRMTAEDGGGPSGGDRPPDGGGAGGRPPAGGGEPPSGGGRPPGGGDGGDGGRTSQDAQGGTQRQEAEGTSGTTQRPSGSEPSSGYTPGQPRSDPRFRNIDEVRDFIQANSGAEQDRYINMSSQRIAETYRSHELRPSGSGPGPGEGFDDIFSTRPGSGPHGYSYADGTHVVRVPSENCVPVHHVRDGVFYDAQNQVIPTGQVAGKIAVFPGQAADDVLRYVTPDGRLRDAIPSDLLERWSTNVGGWVKI